MKKVKQYTITNWDDVSEADIQELAAQNGLVFHHKDTAVMGRGPTPVHVFSQLHLDKPEDRQVALHYFPKKQRASLTNVFFKKGR